MSNQEPKDKTFDVLRFVADNAGLSTLEAIEKAYNMGLCKQEPCEDAISRDELLKAIDTWDKFGCDANTKLVPYQDHYIPYIHYDDVIKCIKGMPPITPQPKIGQWVLQPSNKDQDERDFIWWKCSECGQVIFSESERDRREFHAFCGRCGAKMT